MASVKLAYGTEAQTITCTLAGLTTGSSRQSTAVDNTTNLFLDALVMLKVTTGGGTIGSDKAVYVYAYGTVDVATPTYPDAVTGTDGAITLVSPSELRQIGVVFTPAISTAYTGGPWSVAAAFGGVLPEKWGIVVTNSTNTTLDAVEGNHKKIYQGAFSTVA